MPLISIQKKMVLLPSEWMVEKITVQIEMAGGSE